MDKDIEMRLEDTVGNNASAVATLGRLDRFLSSIATKNKDKDVVMMTRRRCMDKTSAAVHISSQVASKRGGEDYDDRGCQVD